MNQQNIIDAVEFYRNMMPEGIDHLRGLTDDEVAALKVVLAITETGKPLRKVRADAGTKRGKKSPIIEKGQTAL